MRGDIPLTPFFREEFFLGSFWGLSHYGGCPGGGGEQRGAQERLLISSGDFSGLKNPSFVYCGCSTFQWRRIPVSIFRYSSRVRRLKSDSLMNPSPSARVGAFLPPMMILPI
jgi:hypothetical protein